MREIYPKFYDSFKCLGGKCPHTCCQGWGVDIDKNTLARYKNVDGIYGAKLKQILSNHKQFFKVGATCPFLNKDGLCDIQNNLGESYLCDVCKKFPRVEYIYGNVVEHNLSPACIPVAYMILNEGINLIEKNTDRLITTYSTFDTKFYPYMINARSLIFDALNSLNYNNALMFMLDFGEYLQNHFRVYTKLDEVINSYKQKLTNYNLTFTSKLSQKIIIKLIKEYLKMDMLTPFINDKLQALLRLIYNDRISIKDVCDVFNKYRDIAQFKNVTTYYIYKYYLRCVYDYSMNSRIKFSVYTAFILMLLSMFDGYTNGKIDVDVVAKNFEIMAREIEHNEDNIKKLNKYFTKKDPLK